MMFFCGNDPDCIGFNTKEALAKAKETVEKNFALVGVLEKLDQTFDLLEAFVPKYFSGLKSLYQ